MENAKSDGIDGRVCSHGSSQKYHRDISVSSDRYDHSSDATDNTPKPSEDFRYPNWEIICSIYAILGFVFDIGSDIFVAYMFYVSNQWWWFGLTVAFIVVPSLTMTSVSFVWYVKDEMNKDDNSKAEINTDNKNKVFFKFNQTGHQTGRCVVSLWMTLLKKYKSCLRCNL